jgi:hypothetical protein
MDSQKRYLQGRARLEHDAYLVALAFAAASTPPHPRWLDATGQVSATLIAMDLDWLRTETGLQSCVEDTADLVDQARIAAELRSLIKAIACNVADPDDALAEDRRGVAKAWWVHGFAAVVDRVVSLNARWAGRTARVIPLPIATREAPHALR